eukprot:4822653-Prymnesium_polylepis.1
MRSRGSLRRGCRATRTHCRVDERRACIAHAARRHRSRAPPANLAGDGFAAARPPDSCILRALFGDTADGSA